MRVILHIGPHKTGTTSVQSMLLSQFGSPEPHPPVWYPVPEKTGPGHAMIARLTVGILGRDSDEKDPSYIRQLLSKAEKEGVETIILSSENFSRAYPNQLGRLKEALRPFEVNLVITLTPIARRVVSNWQQMVRNGLTLSLPESTDQVFERESLAPDLVPRFCDALGPQRAILIIVDADAPPSNLLVDFLEATELVQHLRNPLSNITVKQKINISLGEIETGVMRFLNLALAEIQQSHDDLHAVQLRQIFLRTLQSPEWHSQCPHVPLTLPESMMDDVRELERKTHEQLKVLIGSGGLRMRGDPNAIFSLITGDILVPDLNRIESSQTA